MAMTERVQIVLLQIVGGLAVAGIGVGAAWIGMQGYPEIAGLLGPVMGALIGTLFGTPIAAVTLNQVSKMPPPMAAEVARRAIASLPPDTRHQLQAATVVLTGISDRPPPTPPSVPPGAAA
jgi:hypothetical protein